MPTNAAAAAASMHAASARLLLPWLVWACGAELQEVYAARPLTSEGTHIFRTSPASQRVHLVKIVHPKAGQPSVLNAPIHVHLEISASTTACFAISASSAGSTSPAFLEIPWHRADALQYISTLRISEDVCPEGPCTIRVWIMASHNDTCVHKERLATSSIEMVMLASDDREVGSAIDCDFGPYERMLHALPVHLIEKGARDELGCLRSCHFTDVCFEQQQNLPGQLVLIHGNRLTHGSDVWMMPAPRLGLCSNFLASAPQLRFIEVSRVQSKLLCGAECKQHAGSVIVHFPRASASRNLWHVLFEEFAAVFGLMQAANAQSLLLLGDEITKQHFNGLDYSILASIVPPLRYQCFDHLYIGSHPHTLFHASPNLDRGGRHTPEPEISTRWDRQDVIRFRSLLLRRFQLVPTIHTAPLEPLRLGALRRDGESRDVIDFDQSLRAVKDALQVRMSVRVELRNLSFSPSELVAAQTAKVCDLDLLIGAMGAGLSHMFFMREQATVIVLIFEYMRYARKVWQEYAMLAQFVGVRYFEFWSRYASYDYIMGPYSPPELTPRLLKSEDSAVSITLRRHDDDLRSGFYYRTNLFCCSTMALNTSALIEFVVQRVMEVAPHKG